MELPIRVMIVLFVAIVVGALVILLSRNVIDSAKREIIDIGKKEPEKIVDKGDERVTTSEVVYLAQSCYETRMNEVLSRELCYIIHGDIQTTSNDLRTALTDAGVPHTVDGFFGGTLYSLSIYFDPTDKEVEILR